MLTLQNYWLLQVHSHVQELSAKSKTDINIMKPFGVYPMAELDEDDAGATTVGLPLVEVETEAERDILDTGAVDEVGDVTTSTVKGMTSIEVTRTSPGAFDCCCAKSHIACYAAHLWRLEDTSSYWYPQKIKPSPSTLNRLSQENRARLNTATHRYQEYLQLEVPIQSILGESVLTNPGLMNISLSRSGTSNFF
ncbi:hypothetical protein AMATHDRAFT_5302 [Amanita thiersii Skay4041]|uniref:Uncharacterized protein n=1 Tax=Amanita thiersii Skay4041 TaxID=703135 RepID=A0A2A9NKZ1_9AGAR|nr:hypothetical protein AMATHDRAFT_5302 [Amanita thiersii Skay4041]